MKKNTRRLQSIMNDRGIALAMVLVLSAITLGVMSGLVYMITTGTVTSGVHKRYKTAYEANFGGLDISQEIVVFRGDEDLINGLCDDLQNCAYTTPLTCVPSTDPECTKLKGYDNTYTKLDTKLNLTTDCWENCDDSLTIDPDTDSTYDIRFEIGTAPAPVYNIFAKIIDTTVGNSSGIPSEVVRPCGVAPGCNDAQVPQIVYLYTLEVLSQSASNPLERSKTSTLFAY